MATEDKKPKKKFSRRKFLQRGAIVLGSTIVTAYLGRGMMRRYAAETVEGLDFPSMISTFQPDFWFEILPDNTILLKSPKVEMGQGIFTGFAMLAAEELEVPLSQIRVEHANTLTGPVDMATGGSNSTSSLFVPIREVAATMREMLKKSAAKQWGVADSTVTAQNGVLSSGTKKMTYAEVARSTQQWDIPKTPALKPKSSFKYVGKEAKRVDLKAKVLGKPLFAIDKSLPDMLYAVILQSPHIGGTLKSINTKEAAKTTDVVKIIEEKDLVAVVAKNRYAAETALRKIQTEWDVPKKWQQADFEEIVTVGKGNAVNVQKEGDAEGILKKNKENVFKQEYRTPMAAHAHMEPNGSVAHVEKDKATVTIGTQMPSMLKGSLAKVLDIDDDKLNLELAYLGGGFGRRGLVNNASQAALISKAVGKPVHVFNTRQQEFQNGVYRPNTHHVLEAKVGKDGTIEAISHNQATPDMVLESMGGGTALSLFGSDFISAGHGASILYNIKNKSTAVWQNKLPIMTGIWRSVGMFPNTFAIESFMNELARKTAKDPIDLRLELLKGDEKINERYVKVLETLKDKSGWKNAKANGIGRGVAICNDRKTISAVMTEITVVDNKIQVKKVTQVIDAGLAINPEGIRQQVEGATMMGITAALYEGLQVKDGQIAATNFHEYPMATLSDTPEIEVIIVEGHEEPYGVGEPPLAPVAPAIAAAVFDLTGKNLRSLPLKLS